MIVARLPGINPTVALNRPNPVNLSNVRIRPHVVAKTIMKLHHQLLPPQTLQAQQSLHLHPHLSSAIHRCELTGIQQVGVDGDVNMTKLFLAKMAASAFSVGLGAIGIKNWPPVLVGSGFSVVVSCGTSGNTTFCSLLT